MEFEFKIKIGIVILSRLKLSEIEPPQPIYAGRRICTGSLREPEKKLYLELIIPLTCNLLPGEQLVLSRT